MALPVYAEEDPLPDAPGEVELLKDEQETASGENTALPEQNAATPVPDAATPEPEQSAEPEQPAPTPEPAATATATPVPTVTPTATPEPTEQPQKMYAAKSVDSVQAVSEQEATDGFTVYFVVPDTMPGNQNQDVKVLDSDEIRFNVNTNANSPGDCWQSHTMEPTGWETNGHKIYAVKNCKDIKGEKFKEIQFQLYRNGTWTAQVKLGNNPGSKSDFNNKMYVPAADGRSGKWTDKHIYYAEKTIKFENRSTANLTDVKANFYIPDKDGNLTLVNSSEALPVTKGQFVSFTIPTDPCSYVRFTWGVDGHSKYYNFYNESVSDEDKESFLYSEISNCFIYTDADNVRWGIEGIEKYFRIYYDATFSKLPTTGTGDTSGDYSIPKANNSETIYFRIKGGDGVESESGTLVKDGTNENLYYIDIPQGYSSIIFSGEKINGDEETKGNGVSTEWLPIPTDDKNCFYADTNDDAVYKDTTTRGGYWAPKGTKRDAEEWKNRDAEAGKKTPIVDIASADFTEEPNTKYVTSTLYDYYTDYELNGKNRDGYGEYRDASHRTWVPFREFDQALSDYYKDANAPYPLYTGHFQPAGSPEFSQIAGTLKLFGYSNDDNVKFNRFMAINNAQRNEDNTSGNEHTYYAYQGLVADKTSTGKADGAPLLNGTETSAVEPHFNKDFLLGENSKKAKLGEVYENVKFPFTKVKNLFDNETDVDYWCFDSKDTTLYLKQDSGQNSDSKYFLQSADNRESSRNVSASSNSKDLYGYFPFNETANPGVFSTYNYGFGTKLQMDFTLTDDGKVETKNADGTKGRTSIKFFFSGDDDVWVFIDGQLALDVGGAHGEVSGLLEFGETKEDGKEKNSVTAYVSRVKKGGTSDKDDKDKDEKNGNTSVKTVTYNKNKDNKEVIDFYAKGTTLTFDKGQKHTLTMYYMERGMWESNMAVAFNFPDNNELQVQKIVDKKDVNEWFKSCFDTPDLFAFTIQNQATHYQNPQHDATIDSDENLIKLNTSNYASCKPVENSKGIIFEPTTALDGEEALHWYAQYPDTNPPSGRRSERYGILTLNDAINISQKRYLTFKIYAKSESDQGVLSLGNLYLELLDKNKKQKGCLGTTCLNGTTYGTVTLENDKWITIKLDLNKLNAEEGFDLTQVTTIRVGDNYPRHIYFKDFVFSAQAKATTKTGFTTKQEDIPVYGSINAGGLTNAAGAQFTTTKNNDTHVVDENGQFMLQNGETVTFSDQFRRGSYISLKETLNPNLYDTTWTVYENGQKVTSMKGDSTVKTVEVTDTNKSLDRQKDPADGPDDGRTEVYDPAQGIANNGYTASQKPKNANTIVFRSYKNPDETTSSLTKLKVQFVNTVKTGDLVIQKAAASDEVDLIKGKYTFNVTFTNVGGVGLEKDPIEKQVTIDMNDKDRCEISGIPIGTRFRIEEVTTNDGSHLQGVSVTGGGVDTKEVDNTYVQGSIGETDVTATFTNTMHELINIDFTKTWENANGSPLEDGLPGEIYIQLQRRKTKNDPWKPVRYPEDAKTEYVTVTPARNGWNCAFTFANLDKFDVEDHTNYEYRIVEGTLENGNFTKVEPKETIPIKGNTYVVTAKAEAKISDEDGTKKTNATVGADGTITGGSGTIVLTNKLQNPKFVLDIIKKDAELNNESKEVFLEDVEFKLEKLVETTTGGEPQYTVDTDYKFSSNENKNYLTGITGADGKIIDNPFKNLEPGTYRLTETKAHPGYNLLAQPIVIEFTQGGKCSIDGVEVSESDGSFIPGANNTYTMTLTVLNRKTPELPHTGADAPSLWLLIGMPLAVAGLLIFTFRYNRKGGRRH